MFYRFCDDPIISRRVDRRSPKEKRRQAEIAESRRESLADALEVDQLLAMGFYDSKNRKLPHGVEVWVRHCTVRDKFGEWEELSVPTLAVCLPYPQSSPKLLKMNPNFWEESQTYYWGFKQKSQRVVLWCCLDLLNRLLSLPDWRECESIPLRWRWRADNEKATATVKAFIEIINDGRFALPPRYHPPDADRLPLANLRHNYTPYDYEWQTGKKERNEARAYWNQQIEEQE